MTYREEVLAAIDTLIDLCAYHNGEQCTECEAYVLCKCNRPIDVLTHNNSSNNNKD